MASVREGLQAFVSTPSSSIPAVLGTRDRDLGGGEIVHSHEDAIVCGSTLES